MAKGYLINKKDGDDGQGGGGGGASDDNSGDDGGKDGESDDAGKGKGGADDKPGDGDKDGDKDGDGDKKPAEKSATELALDKANSERSKLLKESLTRKDKIKELEKTVAKFDGIDLDAVKKLMENAADAETKKLEDKGAWESLKDQLVTKQADAVKILTDRIAELEGNTSKRDGVIEKLTVGHAFDASKFITDEMTLPASKARIVYGNHFDIVDGAVVAFDKPRGSESRAPLIDGKGDPLGFDAALTQIVNADPDRDTLIRSKMKPGSDSKDTKHPAKPGKDNGLRGKDRIAAGLKASQASN